MAELNDVLELPPAETAALHAQINEACVLAGIDELGARFGPHRAGTVRAFALTSDKQLVPTTEISAQPITGLFAIGSTETMSERWRYDHVPAVIPTDWLQDPDSVPIVRVDSSVKETLKALHDLTAFSVNVREFGLDAGSTRDLEIAVSKVFPDANKPLRIEIAKCAFNYGDEAIPVLAMLKSALPHIGPDRCVPIVKAANDLPPLRVTWRSELPLGLGPIADQPPASAQKLLTELVITSWEEGAKKLLDAKLLTLNEADMPIIERLANSKQADIRVDIAELNPPYPIAARLATDKSQAVRFALKQATSYSDLVTILMEDPAIVHDDWTHMAQDTPDIQNQPTEFELTIVGDYYVANTDNERQEILHHLDEDGLARFAGMVPDEETQLALVDEITRRRLVDPADDWAPHSLVPEDRLIRNPRFSPVAAVKYLKNAPYFVDRLPSAVLGKALQEADFPDAAYDALAFGTKTRRGIHNTMQGRTEMLLAQGYRDDPGLHPKAPMTTWLSGMTKMAYHPLVAKFDRPKSLSDIARDGSYMYWQLNDAATEVDGQHLETSAGIYQISLIRDQRNLSKNADEMGNCTTSHGTDCSRAEESIFVLRREEKHNTPEDILNVAVQHDSSGNTIRETNTRFNSGFTTPFLEQEVGDRILRMIGEAQAMKQIRNPDASRQSDLQVTWLPPEGTVFDEPYVRTTLLPDDDELVEWI